jgi:hypothetical protein
MEEIAKETVIIVHGTWAAPQAEKNQWYEPTDGVPTEGFTARLNAALQKRGSAARCWAHCSRGGHGFHWSGENSWVARTRAADALGDYVAKLRKERWRCHIVAHSHGGNVLVEALPKMTTLDYSVPLGRLVTLGTPFMDVMTPILNQDKRRQRTLLAISFMVCVFAIFQSLVQIYGWTDPVTLFWFAISGLLLGAAVFRWDKQLRLSQVTFQTYLKANWRQITIEVTFWLVTGILSSCILLFTDYPGKITAAALTILFVMGFARLRQGRTVQGIAPALNLTEASRSQPCFLAIGSRMDEAWQVLHHLRNSDNPLAVRSNALLYFFSAFRSSLIQRKAIDRIHYGSFRDIGYVAALQTVLVYCLVFPVVVATYLGLISSSPTKYYEGAIPVEDFLKWVIIIFLIVSLSMILLLGNKFFVALLLPIRWFIRILGSPAAIVRAMGTYAVRAASWSVFVKNTMGLEGYQFKVPLIEQFPSYLNVQLGKYEDMPIGAETSALKNRSSWIEKHIGDVSATFSKVAVTAADISSLLRAIEADQSLVHAAYYTDDECIARIADWIAAEDDLRSNAAIAASRVGS